MNIICFGSGSGTTIEAILENERKGQVNYRVKGMLVNRKCRCMEVAEKYDVPLIYNSRKRFLGEKSGKPSKSALEKYDRKNVQSIRELEKLGGFEADLICLAGYWAVFSKPILRAFGGRIINSHPADLSILRPDGKRGYAGIYGHHAILEAMKNGEKGTRTCIHLVTEGVDEGEILVTSRLLPFAAEAQPLEGQVLEEYAKKHQEMQKKECDYPAYLKALELISTSRLSLGEGKTGSRTVYLDGKPLGSRGFVMEMECTVTELGGGRIQAMFSEPIAPLSGEELFRVFKFGRECEIVSRGRNIVGVRASERLVGEFLTRVDESGKAIDAYKKSRSKDTV